MEQEQEDFNRQLFSQILEPLRAMVTGAPLEDARHLAQRYSRMRQEAETQAAEVSRRHARVREAPIPENVAKFHAAESKMHELKANMAVLGKEAATALASVESQQQRLTFQRLVSLVEGEKSYHERIATILGGVEAEMVSEKQRKESAPPVIPSTYSLEKTKYFLAEAMHAFDAASEKELSLAVDDYVVVRKVSLSGWSEGECRGKAGWFPSEHVEKRLRIPTNSFENAAESILAHEVLEFYQVQSLLMTISVESSPILSKVRPMLYQARTTPIEKVLGRCGTSLHNKAPIFTTEPKRMFMSWHKRPFGSASISYSIRSRLTPQCAAMHDIVGGRVLATLGMLPNMHALDCLGPNSKACWGAKSLDLESDATPAYGTSKGIN
ncbi:hypothetical protein TEA_003570 [Camellia sinensis var. sinensis]|uniref:SH3 domain-containing protein n=1 Tax=Camellia sinensis var. sinensis TaxID=542762 RepID=A0A4S4DJY6_CAMSN|nr:hypothetical protein TEA_003570 [Camellia sinensis var. sinensis]